MLRAVGMTDDDWDKPQIGVASSWNEVTPCNLPLDRLAKRAKDGVRDAGGFPLEFMTIAVSDGISMGHEGMRASLVSREVIADSVETVMHAERFDGLVTFAGCDKSLPGMLMAAARLNLPTVFLYGGRILPGRGATGEALDIVSVFEAVGARAAGALTDEELALIERNACPTEGSCAGMFTANTMAVGVRGARHGPARQRVGAGRRPPARRLRLPSGRAVVACSSRHPAPPDPDQGGVRERHRRDHGPRAARPTPCCTCWPSPTRPGSSSTSTTSTGSGAGCRTSPTPSPTGGTTWSTSTASAGSRSSCGSCSTPACSTATA